MLVGLASQGNVLLILLFGFEAFLKLGSILLKLGQGDAMIILRTKAFLVV